MIPLRKLVDRGQFGSWLTANKYVGMGVEIGTFRGEYAKLLLETWGGLIVTIDPYSWKTDQQYVDGCTIDWKNPARPVLDPEAVFEEAARNCDNPRCKLLRCYAEDVAPTVDDYSLDFVYIDGNHAGEAVKRDIDLWWPKVRPGGILGGHDLYTRDDELQKCGVFDAVLDFSQLKQRRPHATACTSWWIQK